MQRPGGLKKRILDRAAHFFFELGYSRVTTAEIAAELGISKKTLYKLFPSKMLLLRSVIRRGVKEGIVRADVDERLIILLHQLVMENIINPEQLQRLSVNPLEMFEAMIRMLYGGILAEKARDKFFRCENSRRADAGSVGSTVGAETDVGS